MVGNLLWVLLFPFSFCLFKGEPCSVSNLFFPIFLELFLVLLVVGLAVASLPDSFLLVRHTLNYTSGVVSAGELSTVPRIAL